MKEEVGLEIRFEEIKLRGSDKYECVIRATEIGVTVGNVDEILISDSWADFKQNYPTLKDILIQLFPTDSWNPSWRKGETSHLDPSLRKCNRILFINSIYGHEGLYEFDENQRVEVDWDTEVAIKR